ncbi:hypothetical protein [Thiomicrorhabdus aquaedulcis]|uniref:hypothetical protein n=1 Tax=Thiomicrorhabdus aquaedulcis TaxID=2211106 RepID=UPI000FDCA5ED|nr:hypothetical protein [Thiomicrorhabdus aquaedulcis]
MKNIHEIRRQSCVLLVEHAGSMMEFARQIERSPTQVSRFVGKNPTRNIGERLARHIERCFCISEFWLDIDHSFLDPPEFSGSKEMLPDKHEQLHAILSDILLADQSNKIDEVTYNQLLEIAKNNKPTVKPKAD